MLELEDSTKEETKNILAAQIKHLELMTRKLEEGVPLQVVHDMIAAGNASHTTLKYGEEEAEEEEETTGGGGGKSSPGQILLEQLFSDDDEEEEEDVLNQSL